MALRLNGGANSWFQATPFGQIAPPLSLACWFNVPDVTANYMLVGLGNPSTGERIAIQASGNVAADPVRAIHSDVSTTAVALTTTGFAANTWHHAAGVFRTNSTRRVFLNGAGEGADATARGSVATVRATIGRNPNNSAIDVLNGLVAHGAIWGKALEIEEVRALASGVHPLRVAPSALVGFWPLEDDASSLVNPARPMAPQTGASWAWAPGPPVEPAPPRRTFVRLLVPQAGGVGTLAGSAAGIGTAQGTLRATRALSGSAGGVGATAATLRATRRMVASGAGIGTTSAGLSARRRLAATVVGFGTASAALRAIRGLSATATGLGAAIATLSIAGATTPAPRRRRVQVAAIPRVLVVPAASRIAAIPAMSRVVIA